MIHLHGTQAVAFRVLIVDKEAVAAEADWQGLFVVGVNP